MKTKMTFYPVGNGDCNLLEIKNGPKILFDCKFITEAEEENSDKFNVIKDLLNNKLKNKRKGLPFLDAFILSHADQDHCLNFKEKFYLGDPDNISDDDKSNKKILIGELWYSPRVILDHKDGKCEDANAFTNEAKRRMQLYKDGSKEADKDGNRIRIIGWTDDDCLEGIPDDIITVPKHEISEVNGKNYKNFRMYIHAPFKDHIENEDRNQTSIVMQIRIDTDKKVDAGKMVLGGDAEWPVWEKIMNSTNKEDEFTLEWGLFEAPHHCSYTYFNDDRDKDPKQTSLDFLDKREDNAFMVSSSKLILKNSDNPPCQKAKNRYTERVGEDNFFCTAGDSKDEDENPVVFVLDDGGFCLEDDVEEEKEETKSRAENNTRPHVYG